MPGCSVLTQRRFIDEHVKICPLRIVECTLCKASMSVKKRPLHMKVCPLKTLSCSASTGKITCGIVFTRGEVLAHRLECLHSTQTCAAPTNDSASNSVHECGKTFAGVEKFYAHFLAAHLDEPLQAVTDFDRHVIKKMQAVYKMHQLLKMDMCSEQSINNQPGVRVYNFLVMSWSTATTSSSQNFGSICPGGSIEAVCFIKPSLHNLFTHAVGVRFDSAQTFHASVQCQLLNTANSIHRSLGNLEFPYANDKNRERTRHFTPTDEDVSASVNPFSQTLEASPKRINTNPYTPNQARLYNGTNVFRIRVVVMIHPD
jgi:hypothetical protein